MKALNIVALIIVAVGAVIIFGLFMKFGVFMKALNIEALPIVFGFVEA